MAQETSDVATTQFDAAWFEELDFRMIGPSRGGRVTTVAGHADQPHTFYMGSTGGGVWKTTNDGVTWENISDDFFETASIGSIDVADSNPDIIYIGTGSDGIRSNVIVGRGIYKSTDGGASWSHIGLRKTGQIGAVVVHPTNPEVVYVAALGSPFGPNPERGVYKTVDGGETWDQVLFISDRTGAIDLELNPSNPDEIYAAIWHAERKPWTIISGDDAEDGFYKSADAGANWRKVEKGLPQGLIGKIDLAVSPDDPSRVYALVEAIPEEEGLYRSNDRGESWHLVNGEGKLMTRPFYYTNVDADPTDADIVYVNNLRFHKSTNAGKSFTRISTPHGDNHDMWINPDDPDIFIQSNDGGANVTLNGGQTWSTQHNQPTAELYQVHVDDAFPYRVYAGQQDNTTIAVPSLPPLYKPGGPTAFWEDIGGCETGPAVPRTGDPNIVYSNCKGTFRRYNRTTGQEQHYYVGGVYLYGRNPKDLPFRFQRVVPIEVSPHDPDIIYHGSQYVHRTIDEGKTWETISPDLTAFRPERQVVSGSPITRDITGEEHYSTLYVIEESPIERGVIWTGANDGPVYVTRDDGQAWTEVTPPNLPPEGRIQTIDPSPHQPGKAYIAAYRYLLNDWTPYIYRTTDYGATWTHLTDGTNGIPNDSPTRVIREDPNREGLLYAGTEFGLYISFDDGAQWQPFQLDLPVTPITDIKIHRKDLVLSTMGRGFWIMDNLTPLYQLNDDVAAAEQHLFQPRDPHRMRYRASNYGPAGPEFIPPGLMVDYYLAEEPGSDISLEILGTDGTVVRHYTAGADTVNKTTETQGMRAPVSTITDPSSLEKSAGMHRFRWDLRYQGPPNEDGDRRSGPLAVPGTYQVRLTVDDWSETRTFEVLIDPRIAMDEVSQDDLVEQRDFNLKMTELIANVWNVVEQIDSMKVVLGDVESAAEALQELGDLHNAIVTKEGDSYPEPMLAAQMSYLYGMTSQGDQKPGRDAHQRYEDLKAELELIIQRLEVLKESAPSAIGSEP